MEKKQAPKQLYKYMSSNRAERFLQSPSLRFSPPVELNDIFELTPPIELGKNTLKRRPKTEGDEKIETEALKTASRKIRRAVPKITKQSESAILNVDIACLREMQKIWEDRLHNHVGVLSLSSVYDSLLMWAHYCQSHKGAVFGFDASHDFFAQGRSDIESFGAKEVSYFLDRPCVSISELRSKNPDEIVDDLVQIVLLSKGEDWKYEDEWRVIVKGIDKITVLDDGGRSISGVVPVPIGAIKSVYVGSRATEELKKKARKFCKNNRLYFFQAKPHRSEFKLIFE